MRLMLGRNGDFDIGYATDVGSRGNQEDNLGFRQYEDGSVLAVLADGMGGHTGGEVASEMAIQWFGEYFPQTHGSIRARLEQTLRQTQQRLCLYAQEHPELQDMGSTLVAVFVQGQDLYWLSVGDSLLYRADDTGIVKLNATHTVAERFRRLWESGKISRAELDNVQEPHALTSALGPDKLQEIDCQQATLPTDAVLVLASDGLLSLNPVDINTLLDKQASAQILAERLLMATLAKRQQGQDNISLIVLKHPVLPVTQHRRRWPLILGATLLLGAATGMFYQWHQAEQRIAQERQERQEAEQRADKQRQALAEEKRQRMQAEQEAAASRTLAEKAARRADEAEQQRKAAKKRAEKAEHDKKRAEAAANAQAVPVAPAVPAAPVKNPPPPSAPAPVPTPKPRPPPAEPVQELDKRDIFPDAS
ncbi:MAG: protein phosphatase 2C domain-containing protein [Candidatus Thiothrix putei]|uniref:Protein phosphatase 2C domain-containing protein n=1 Tax=Candidatus Thiothrix putei TaxID=3080811 RepID=A0AA95KK78_9GAMM|nr:MAG: protein phosphatase 2C domain-containing protein [Candidatus Thiothrix putei]